MAIASEDRTAGALLAGGGSRRMGRDKALLPFGSTRLIERPAAALAEVVDDWAVFGGDPESLGFLGAPIYPDGVPSRGPLGGLAAALRHFAARPVLLVACDLPFVEGWQLRALLDRAAARDCDAVVPLDGAWSQPLCAWYSPRVLRKVESALAAEELAVLEFVRALDSAPFELEPAPDATGPSWLSNVNSPADYKLAESAWRGRSSSRGGAP